MWSRFTVMSSALVVLGCVSTGSTEEVYRKEILGLNEMSFQFVIDEWGEPDSRLPKSEGFSARFERIQVFEEDTLSGDIVEKLCAITIDVDKDKVITKWEYQDCKQLSSAPQDANDGRDPSDDEMKTEVDADGETEIETEVDSSEESYEESDDSSYKDLPMSPL